MTQFAVAKPVSTTEPNVVVDAGLAVGAHRFQLEVMTADGRRSAAVQATVSVSLPTPPVPIHVPTPGPIPIPTPAGPAAPTT